MGDRSTYRMYEDGRLIEEAIYNPNRELAIVLGERLQDALVCGQAVVDEARERVKDFEIDYNKLDDRIYELAQEIDKLELMLSERERIIDELKKDN